MTLEYKLYQDGVFYDLINDKLEKNPLEIDSLKSDERIINTTLENELKKHPKWE